MFKRFLSSFILIVFAMTIIPLQAMSEDVFRGHAEKDEQVLDKSELFTGHVENLDRKDVIKMTVSQVLDGTFSVEGDEFFAEVTDDVEGDKGIIIPKGTVAHGKIIVSKEAKRMGIDGSLDLDFDYLITPDGREIPIEGKMTTRLHPMVATAKIVATDVGYTAVGGAVGGFLALNWLGIEAAIASQGYTVMGGAAIGGAIGLGASLWRKGKNVMISPGDEIRVKINTSVPLPVYSEKAFKQHELAYNGLEVRITNISYEKDPFGDLNTITLTLAISNMSDKTFSSFDFALVNDYNAIFHPSVFGDTKLMFKQIKPGDRMAGRVSFSVDNIRRKFWLTFYDRSNRKVLAKISVDNAYRTLPEKVKKKNAKVKKTKNYYKENEDMGIDLDL